MPDESMETLLMSREKAIVKTSIIGIVINILLAIFKAVIGIISHSIAITLDAVLSASVLCSAIIFIIWQISLEAYVGMIIAIFIIKAGVEMMSDTLNEIVGKRSNSDMIKKIKTILCQEDEVCGAYDLILYN